MSLNDDPSDRIMLPKMMVQSPAMDSTRKPMLIQMMPKTLIAHHHVVDRNSKLARSPRWSDKRRLCSLLATDSDGRRGRRRCQGGVAGGAGTVEEVVGVEGNDLPLRRDKVDARALDAADAKIESVHELHDD